MTREEAKQALAATSCFKRVGERIALREVALIEAVQAHHAKTLVSTPDLLTFPERAHPIRSA